MDEEMTPEGTVLMLEAALKAQQTLLANKTEELKQARSKLRFAEEYVKHLAKIEEVMQRNLVLSRSVRAGHITVLVLGAVAGAGIVGIIWGWIG